MPGKNKNKPSNSLIKDSHYHVKSLSTREELLETKGYFRGYVALGRAHALRMELDGSHGENEGSVRVIPCHMVTQIDIIEEADTSEEDDSGPNSYFG